MTRFTADNTEGYTAADLANLNDLFRAACAAEGVDPENSDEIGLDAIAERVLAAYDNSHGSGIVQIGRE